MASATIGIFPWMTEEPGDGAIALEDTYLFWNDSSAPVRKLDRPWEDHLMVLSLLFADLARKLGIPLEDTRDPAAHPPIPAIKASMREKTERMRAEEAEWIKAFMASAR